MSPKHSARVVIVDAGPLVALADSDDGYHHSCLAWLQDALTRRHRLIVPLPVVTEVCQLLARCAPKGSADYEVRFLRNLAADRPFELYTPTPVDLLRMADLVEQYADFPLGGADASVIAAAEAVGTAYVATVDRRHFTAVRPKHVAHFELLPEPL